MLNAFTARSVIELGAKDKRKIESAAISGDRLLIGLSTGSLLVYRLSQTAGFSLKTPPSSPTKRPVELLREVNEFSRSGIKQLGIVKEANLLVALTENHVSIYDLREVKLQEQLTATKGAISFAVLSSIVKDPETGFPSIVSRLAVLVKKKLLLWTWSDTEAPHSLSAEISLPNTARSVAWANGDDVICGLTTGFVRVNVITKLVSDIFQSLAQDGQEGIKFGAASTGGMSYVGMGGWGPRPLATALGESGILLVKDVNSLFIDYEGSPQGKRQIPWTAAPDSIAYSYPYLLALQLSKGTLEVRNPETLTLLQSISLPNATQLYVPSSGVSLAHGGKGFIVASDRGIWRMDSVRYDAQIDELVEKEEFDEAISILDMLEDALLDNKEGKTREIKIRKARSLFDNKDFRSSLDLFTAVSAPPELVIRLYPPQISGIQPESNGESRPTSKGGEPTSPRRRKRNSGSSGKSILENVYEGAIKPAFSSVPEHKLEGKELKDAVIELCGFLVQTRTKLQRFITPAGLVKQPDAKPGLDVTVLLPGISSEDEAKEQKLRDTAQLVDTTLFRSHMLAIPSLAASLFRIPNFCDPDVVSEKLQASHRYNDLIDFFHGKKLYRPALELLRRFGEREEPDPDVPNLYGPDRTIMYLQSLPPSQVDLILEFIKWPLEKNPDEAMEVFLADSDNAESLPRGKVLDFLSKHDINLARKYLEHITLELGDTTPDFHNRLVDNYLSSLKAEKSPALLEKFLSFLRNSRQYSASRAFTAIPKDDPAFYETRAVVLSKMGQHKQALEIYVFKMQDFAKAEEYCNDIHLRPPPPPRPHRTPSISSKDDDEPPPSIYHTLLALYLAPPAPQKPNFEAALDLLSRHGSRLPTSSTLGLIPDSFPVKDLEYYFLHRIRAANSVINENRIVEGLLKVQYVDAHATLLVGDPTGFRGRNRHVVIDQNRVCRICHKRLGGSLVSVQPDNSVIHLGCAERNEHRRSLSGL